MSHVSHITESSHTYEWVMSHMWASHVTHRYKSVISRVWMSHFTPTNEPRHTFSNKWCPAHQSVSIWASHVTHRHDSTKWFLPPNDTPLISYERVMSRTDMTQSCYTDGWVMSCIDIYQSCQKYGWVSCYAYGWVMSRIQMSHITLMNQSCHAYEWVVSHILENITPHPTCVSHVTYTYDCVSHIWTSHATYVTASCHTCEWVMSQYVLVQVRYTSVYNRCYI